MRAFVWGMIFGVGILGVLVFGYFLAGQAPVATDAAPMPFEKYLAKQALHKALAREMPRNVPIPADESNFRAGAQVYKENCAVCHGLPGQGPDCDRQGNVSQAAPVDARQGRD